MFHAASNIEKIQMPLLESEPDSLIARIDHWKVMTEGDVIVTTVPGRHVVLPEGAIDALATLQQKMYHFRSMHTIRFRDHVEEQMFYQGESLAASVGFVLTHLQYNVVLFGDKDF